LVDDGGSAGDRKCHENGGKDQHPCHGAHAGKCGNGEPDSNDHKEYANNEKYGVKRCDFWAEERLKQLEGALHAVVVSSCDHHSAELEARLKPAFRPFMVGSPALAAWFFYGQARQVILSAILEMDSLRIWLTTAPDLALDSDVSVKASAFLICCVIDPGKLLSFNDEVAVIVRKLLERFLGSLSAAAANLFSPEFLLDFGWQGFLPKHLAQMLWTEAYNG